jgi:hypothetical protein
MQPSEHGQHGFGTLAVHAGSPHDPVTGAVIESVSDLFQVQAHLYKWSNIVFSKVGRSKIGSMTKTGIDDDTCVQTLRGGLYKEDKMKDIID